MCFISLLLYVPLTGVPSIGQSNGVNQLFDHILYILSIQWGLSQYIDKDHKMAVDKNTTVSSSRWGGYRKREGESFGKNILDA